VPVEIKACTLPPVPLEPAIHIGIEAP